MPRRNADGPPPESFQGLDEWAEQVIPCITAAELDGLIAGYRKTASNRRLSAGNRRFALMQAQALELAAKTKKPADDSAG